MKKRDIIFNKYGGRCAYCGCQLQKGWHVDHIEPVVRHLVSGKPYYPEKDTIGNMNPSCGSCNNYKHSFSLETFRSEIGQLLRRLNETSTQYKISKRFGLIIEIEKPVQFYFETINPLLNEMD